MRTALVFTLLALLFSACNIINPDEKEPRYLYIPSFSFATTAQQGTDSEKFTEIWVYANDNIVTVTDLPAMIPILDEGRVNVRVLAGIRNNGIRTTRIFYPFVTSDPFVLDGAPLSIDTVIPAFRYVDDLAFDQSDFDNSTPTMVEMSGNQGSFSLVTNPDYVFEGDRSGLLQLNAGESYLYFKNEENYLMPAGNTVFLELNYSCNDRFAVGLIANTTGTESKNNVLVINPTTTDPVVPTWNKIYIDFGLVAQQNPNAAFFETYFELNASKSDRPLSLYIDNMKIVQFIP
jgi:hypothetical protein